MFKFLLLAMFFAQGVFAADDVRVVIDGQNYTCYKGQDDMDANTCSKAVTYLERKYSACSAPYNSDHKRCFEDILPIVEKNSKCVEVSEACYAICNKPYNADQKYCYKTCFK